MAKRRLTRTPRGEAGAAGSRGSAAESRPAPGVVGLAASRPLLTLGLAALAVKLTVLSQLHAHPLLQPTGDLDSGVYARLAARVVAGDWALGPDVYFLSPLYIYFLASALAVSGGSFLFARTLQVLLGVAAVLLVFDATRRLFGGRAAWAAALLSIGTGVLTFNEVLVLQSALDPLLTALVLWSLVWALGSSPVPVTRFAVAGLSVGLLCANRPNALAFAGVVVLGLLLARCSWAGLKQAAALVAGLTLVLAPFAIRNRVVAGEWVLLTSHGGLNFYIGNNAFADGTYRSVSGIRPSIEGQASDARRVAETAAGHALSSSQVSGHFYGLAWRWIEDKPLDALKLFLRKLLYTVNVADLSLNYSYAYYRGDEPTLLRVLLVGPGLLMPLGLVGVAAGLRGRRGSALAEPSASRVALALPALFVAVYGLSVAAFFVSSRYRLPLLVALAMGAGLAADLLWSRGLARDWFGFAMLSVPILALAIPVYWRTGLDEGLSEERTAMAEELVLAARVPEAEALVTRAAPEHPTPGLLHYRVGRALQASGRCDAAMPHFERAHELDAKQLAVRLGLGQCLLEAGRPADALPHLHAAREVAPLAAGFSRAQALLELGRREEAGDGLAALPLPQDAKAADAAGQMALVAGRPDVAVRFFGQAVALSPSSAELRDRLGLGLAAAGRAPEALAAFEEAIRLDPGRPAAQVNRAVTLAELGRVEEARQQAEAALRLDPTSAKARGLLQALSAPR